MLESLSENFLRTSTNKFSENLNKTHHSYLFPRYHTVTTPKGYRKDTEGISKGYESHTNLIVIS